MSFIESQNGPRQIAAIAKAADLPKRLAAVLQNAPAGIVGLLQCSRDGPQLAKRMSPELSYGRHGGPAPATARAAAVMLLLFRRDGRWHVPITQRPAAMLRHGGQMSLPGGRVEPGETVDEAARRELIEELGVDSQLDMLGPLPERYVYASDYIVSPRVALLTCEPRWRPDASEVERVVELPLEVLLNPAAVGRMTIQRGSLLFHAPCFVFGEDRIWGATAVILAELADILRRISVSVKLFEPPRSPETPRDL
jgi:8-oxo-dGTP pyrophosphatase MutT (NUDIX family)